MEQLLFELLKQSAVVIALGIGNWAQWKEKKEIKADMLKLVETHAQKEQAFNEALQANNNQNTEALTRISVTMETIKDNLRNE
jgi:hypothetical protein